MERVNDLLFLLMVCVIFFLFDGCIEAQEEVFDMGSCIDHSDCRAKCMEVICKTTPYYVESNCSDEVCLCRCVGAELPEIASPEGDIITYKGRIYQKTQKIGGCNGSKSKMDNITIWDDSTRGHVYSIHSADPGNALFECYEWFEKSAIIVRVKSGRYTQGKPVKIEMKNIGDKERGLYPPYYVIERYRDGKWSAIKMILCPCGAECETPSMIYLKPDERMQYQWSQREEYCKDSELISRFVNPGRYRVKSYVGDVGEKESIVSNRFYIVEDIKMSMNTDRDSYHSMDIIKVTTLIESGGDIDNITIRIYGVGDDEYRLVKDFDVNLEAGENNLTFTVNAPLVSECETCKCGNRVRPGKYMIKADISYGGEVIANADKKIILS